jgi:hypothetical protein
MQRCYYYLDKTSRSFSAVIKALNPEMRCAVGVCEGKIFVYLRARCWFWRDKPAAIRFCV